MPARCRSRTAPTVRSDATVRAIPVSLGAGQSVNTLEKLLRIAQSINVVNPVETTGSSRRTRRPARRSWSYADRSARRFRAVRPGSARRLGNGSFDFYVAETVVGELRLPGFRRSPVTERRVAEVYTGPPDERWFAVLSPPCRFGRETSVTVCLPLALTRSNGRCPTHSARGRTGNCLPAVFDICARSAMRWRIFSGVVRCERSGVSNFVRTASLPSELSSKPGLFPTLPARGSHRNPRRRRCSKK